MLPLKIHINRGFTKIFLNLYTKIIIIIINDFIGLLAYWLIGLLVVGGLMAWQNSLLEYPLHMTAFFPLLLEFIKLNYRKIKPSDC